MAVRTHGDWTTLPGGVTWISPPLFSISLDRVTIESQFGPPCLLDEDSNGVGLFDAWCIRFACGLEVALWRFHGAGLTRGWEVHSTQADADHVLFHLEARAADRAHWEPDLCPPLSPRFRVVRMDDSGNVFEVDRFTSRCEAEAIVRTCEARGHKQTYWVETPG